MPAHILPGTRGCSPSGAVLVRTYVSRASSGSGWQAAGRQAGFLGMESRPRTGPFARGSRSAAAQSGSAGRQAAAHRASGTVSAEWEGRNMHTCTCPEGNSARDKTQTRGHAAVSQGALLARECTSAALVLAPVRAPVRSAARFAPSCSRDVAHKSRSAEAEALAWASVHGGGGAARPRGAPRAEGTREAEEAARASGTGRRGAWNHLQRVRDRLGARSSAMTKATTQPAVRAEGRSPRQARSPPAWRIETRASELRRRSRARVDGPGR